MSRPNLRQGLSVTELMVGVAILAIVALGVGTLVQNIASQQKQAVVRDEVSQFVLSFSTWLRTDIGCQAALVGKGFPSTSAVPIVVNGFNGYGASSGSVAIQQGFQIGSNITLANISWRDKGATPTVIRSNLQFYERRIAEFSLQFQTKVGGFVNMERVRTFEIPVYIDPPSIPGKTIRDCFSAMTMADVCSVMGDVYDPVTGRCKPVSVCSIAGSYQMVSCSPSNYGCQSPASATMVNPVTGAQSCPSGSIPSLTGVVTGQHTASCGKKCTVNINNTANIYVCMVCQ